MVLAIFGFLTDLIFLVISLFVDTNKIHIPRKKLIIILIIIAIVCLTAIILLYQNSKEEINNSEPTITSNSSISTSSSVQISSSEEINRTESIENTTDSVTKDLWISVKCANNPEYNDYYVTVEPPKGPAYHFSPIDIPFSIAFQEGTYVITVTDTISKETLCCKAVHVADDDEINILFELPSQQENTSENIEMTTFYLEAICDSKDNYNEFWAYVFSPDGELYKEFDAEKDSQPWIINGPQGVYRCSIKNKFSDRIVKDETVVNTNDQTSIVHTIHFNVLDIDGWGTSFFEEANLVVRLIPSEAYRYDDVFVMIESEYGETYTFSTLDTEELWLAVHSGETYYFHIKESDNEDAVDICQPSGIYVNSSEERENSNYSELAIHLP